MLDEYIPDVGVKQVQLGKWLAHRGGFHCGSLHRGSWEGETELVTIECEELYRVREGVRMFLEVLGAGRRSGDEERVVLTFRDGRQEEERARQARVVLDLNGRPRKEVPVKGNPKHGLD